MTAIKREEIIGDCRLILGDCLEVMPLLGKIDAVVTDPPYMGVVKDKWDNQWKTDAAFLSFIDSVLIELKRMMADNASLYFFASPQMAARAEVEIRKHFNVLNNIVWSKGDSRQGAAGSGIDVTALRRFWSSSTERIIFAEQHGTDKIALGESGYIAKCDEIRGFVFEPLRSYLAGEWKRAGLTTKDANKATKSQMAGHYLTTTQWTLPTREKYEQLQACANRSGDDYLRKDYDYLRKDYEELRKDYEELRRPFNATADIQWNEMWTFHPPKNRNGHPCEKPIPLMAHIITTSTREGQTIIDPFMGSGTTGVACVNLGRKFIGIDKTEKWFNESCERVYKANCQGKLFAPPKQQPKPQGLF